MKLQNRKQRDWEIECRLDLGSPTPRLRTGGGPHPVRNQDSQEEVSGGRASERSVICLSRRAPSLALLPEPSPRPPPVEKLSSTKPVPGAKKVGDRWFRLTEGRRLSSWPPSLFKNRGQFYLCSLVIGKVKRYIFQYEHLEDGGCD